MKNLLCILFALFLLSGCQTTKVANSPDWQLVYEHDKDGKTLYGDKNMLLQYALEGRPVRVHWNIRDIVIHVADAGFLTIMNGELFAQIEDITRQIPDRETRKSMTLDALEQSRWHAIFSTTGETQNFQSTRGELNSRQFPLKWYVFAPVVD